MDGAVLQLCLVAIVAPTKTEVLFIVSAGLGQPSRPLCGAASSFQTHTSQLLVPESERRDGYSYLKTPSV